jgi:Domain of unknown function (DUF222)/HNH endonuclease
VRGLAETWWSARSDDELIGVVEQVHQVSAVLAAVEAGALAEADARDLAKTRLHYGSTGDWLTHLAGLRHGEGKRRLARAKALTGPLARTRGALVDGRCSPDQADVGVAAVTDLPPQDWTRRRGEKLMLRHAQTLNATELAQAGRHLVEVVDPDAVDRRLEAALERDERAAHLGRYLSIREDRAGGVRIRGRGSVEDGALLKAALLPLTRPEPVAASRAGETDGEQHDPRDHGARLWDALVSIAQHALDTDRVPTTHAAPPRLLVTLDHHTLTHQLHAAGVATTADGLELPPSVVRRLACDAEIIPAVYGTESQVLDVGRAHRLVTPTLWTALVARDHHCTFPACTRPPVMCHGHHLHHWADGGTTSLDNLALLCGHHHRVIHHTPWRIRLNPIDRQPEFKPPPKPGMPPEWTRYRPRIQERPG